MSLICIHYQYENVLLIPSVNNVLPHNSMSTTTHMFLDHYIDMSINHLIKHFYIDNVYKLNPINIQRNIKTF